MNYLLKHLFALSAIMLITTACGKEGTEEKPGGNNGGGNTLFPKGKVVCNNNGVADVVVTDGTYFTRTAEDGSYELPYNDKATHVFISTPSGYTVDVERSAVMFWRLLSEVKERNKIDFELKATGDDTKHCFVAVGDPQIRNNATEKNKLSVKCDQLAADIANLGASIPVHVLVAGDVAFDNMDIHAASRESFAKLRQPVYYAIGNHDHKPTGVSSPVSYDYDKTADAVFIQNYGPTCYSFNRGKVHYIVFDNIYFKGGPDNSYDGAYITPAQLKWIEKDLSYITKDHAVVLVAHAPTQTRRETDPATHGNSQKLHALVKGYANVQIITGHTHYNTVVEANGTIEHVVGALCGGFWESSVCLDGTVLGYKFFEVNGTDFKWRYVAAEQTYKQTQFTVFTKATSAKPLSSVSVQLNVWDWDVRWKVQFSEDSGVTWKNMDASDIASNTSYDPTSHTVFGVTATDGLPSTTRQWIKASTTDHLFSRTAVSGVKRVTVKVTTRFGEEYVQDISL